MKQLVPSVAGAPNRHVMTVVSSVLALGLFAGCESELGLASGDYPGLRGENRSCTGAFTPHSDVCWEVPEKNDDGGISADMSASQENMADIDPAKRCVAGIIGTPGTDGTLTVTFTTTDIGGLYAPRNCGAVWLEDSVLFYVRTLELWTAERAQSIVQWNSRACLSDPTITPPDVITSATLPGPATHTSTWDAKDFRGNVTSDGTYTLWLQFSENEIFPEGPFIKIPVTKGPTPFTLNPVDQMGFKGITITWAPKSAAGAVPAP